MNVTLVMSLVKDRLGIRTAVRDTYLTAIIAGIVSELQGENGITLNPDDMSHVMFCVDYATWRYQSGSDTSTTFTGKPLSMPRHLQFRLHNLIIKTGGGQS